LQRETNFKTPSFLGVKWSVVAGLVTPHKVHAFSPGGGREGPLFEAANSLRRRLIAAYKLDRKSCAQHARGLSDGIQLHMPGHWQGALYGSILADLITI
jgi:hypothetical protein